MSQQRVDRRSTSARRVSVVVLTTMLLAGAASLARAAQDVVDAANGGHAANAPNVSDAANAANATDPANAPDPAKAAEQARRLDEARKRAGKNPFSGQSVGDVRGDTGVVEADAGDVAPPGPAPFIPGTGAMIKMLLWLALVVVMIYGGVWLFRRYVPNARNMFGGGALKVVGRTYLGPRQSILLVKVGSRLVMVGVTNGQMSPLSEITDPAEVTAITNELAASGGGSGAFRGRLDEANRQMEWQAPDGEGASPMTDDTGVQVRNMRDEIRSITRKISWWRQNKGQ